MTTLTEKAWQELVVAFARTYGWWVFHPFDSRRSTPGFPDLTLVRDQELMFVELKTDSGRVTTEQQHVLDLLAGTGTEVHVWRPADERAAFGRLAQPRVRVAS